MIFFIDWNSSVVGQNITTAQILVKSSTTDGKTTDVSKKGHSLIAGIKG